MRSDVVQLPEAAARPAPGLAPVQLSDVTKRFGSTTAVDRLDLVVQPGEVMGFLGPNGSGKTTTVRMMLGMLRPTAGRVRVLGQDPWSQAPRVHRDTGYVPGDVRLPPRTTAERLLRHYGRLRGDVPARRVHELADRLQLDLTRPVTSLSKGNRQKVALVQALMSHPRLLVLDEPTSGLDPLMQEEFCRIVRERARDGAAVLLSSHLLDEVERVADRVAVLRRGHLVAVERLESLRSAARHHVRVRVPGAADPGLLAGVPGLGGLRAHDDVLTCSAPSGSLDALVKALAAVQVLDVSIEEADLEELFLSWYGEGPDDAH